MQLCMGFMALISLVNCGVADRTEIAFRNTAMESKVQGKLLNIKLSDFWPAISQDRDVMLLGQVLEEIERGRGKSHKYKKLTKTLYPLFMGVLIAKVVLIPLILKMLTAVSSAALVMGKIALITTGLLALKWIFSGSGYGDGNEHTQFELVYVHPNTAYSKPYRGSIKYWGDQSWADSNLIPDVTTADKQKYIPVNSMKNELPYQGYAGYAGSGATSKTNPNNAAASDLYRYNPQPNYNHNGNDGKPFL